MSQNIIYTTLNGLSGTYIELCDLFDRYDLNQFHEVYLKNMDVATKEAFKPYFKRRMFQQTGLTNVSYIASGVPSHGFEFDFSIREGKCMMTEEYTNCFAVQFSNSDDEDIFVMVSLKWLNESADKIQKANNKLNLPDNY